MGMKAWAFEFEPIIQEAHWRAMMTGYRYKVFKDKKNGYWELQPLTERVDGYPEEPIQEVDTIP